MSLQESLKKLSVAPGGAAATAHASTVLKALEECPTPPQIEALLEHVVIFAVIGRGKEMLDALKPWRSTYPDEIRQMEVLLNVTEKPAAAAYEFKRHAESLAPIQGVSVINAFMRGDLNGAIELARDADWFMDALESTDGFIYAVWALSLQEEFEEATELVDTWKAKNNQRDSRADHQILRLEATLSSYRANFEHEVRCLEEAVYIAEANDLGLELTFSKAALAAAYAHLGDIEAAEAIVSEWDETPTGNLVDAYRHLALTDVAMLSKDWDGAQRHAERVLEFYSLRRNPVLYQHVRFVLALVATKSEFRGALDEFARAVGTLPTKRMLTRLDELERLWAAGFRAPRELSVQERTRHHVIDRPLPRLWYPTSAIQAELYVDQVRGLFYAKGRGPFFLTGFPKRLEMLHLLTSSPGFASTTAELFQHVWGMEYVSSRHENKVHVTAHRLRKLVCELSGLEGLVSVADDTIQLETFDVRAVTIKDSSGAPTMTSLDERIVNLLQAGNSLPASDLEVHFGVSRSTIHSALKRLIATEQIGRTGKGRATKYVIK